MFPFEHHRHILCAGDPTDLIGDLLAKPLLQLQTMRKLLRNPRKFREAQDFFVGDVTDGDITPEWQEMVLTERCDPYAGHTYQLVGGHRGKRRLGRARRRPTDVASLGALRDQDLPRWRAATHALMQAVGNNRPALAASRLERYIHYYVDDQYSCLYISLPQCARVMSAHHVTLKGDVRVFALRVHP